MRASPPGTLFEDAAWADSKSISETYQYGERGIALAAFDATNVVSVQACALGESFLREAERCRAALTLRPRIVTTRGFGTEQVDSHSFVVSTHYECDRAAEG